jgi:ABC-type sugar transport system ATPase subunit
VALSRADHIKIDKLLRMGDFCKWASAASSAYGWNKDQFMIAYRVNISSSYVDSIEASTFASGVVQMFKSRIEFTGTPLELLRQVEDNFVSEKVRHSHKWVTTAKGVMSKLNRYQDALETFGIKFRKTRGRTNRTILTITRDVDIYDKASVSLQSTGEWLEEYDTV